MIQKDRLVYQCKVPSQSIRFYFKNSSSVYSLKHPVNFIKTAQFWLYGTVKFQFLKIIEFDLGPSTLQILTDLILSGTNEDIIVKLIGSKSSTDEIRIENRGNVAQTNQIDQFDIAHEGLFLEMLRCVTSRDFL